MKSFIKLFEEYINIDKYDHFDGKEQENASAKAALKNTPEYKELSEFGFYFQISKNHPIQTFVGVNNHTVVSEYAKKYYDEEEDSILIRCYFNGGVVRTEYMRVDNEFDEYEEIDKNNSPFLYTSMRSVFLNFDENQSIEERYQSAMKVIYSNTMQAITEVNKLGDFNVSKHPIDYWHNREIDGDVSDKIKDIW